VKQHHPIPETGTGFGILDMKLPFVEDHPGMEKQEDNDGDKSKPVKIMTALVSDCCAHTFFLQRTAGNIPWDDFPYNLGVRSYKKALISVRKEEFYVRKGLQHCRAVEPL
jgi:hypothetical protein